MKTRNPWFIIQHGIRQDQTGRPKLALHLCTLQRADPQGLDPDNHGLIVTHSDKKRLCSLFLSPNPLTALLSPAARPGWSIDCPTASLQQLHVVFSPITCDPSN